MVLFLTACGGGRVTNAVSGNTAEKGVAVRVMADRNTSRRLSYYYMEAVRQQQKGNYAAAFDLLNHCLDINPYAAEVYFTRSAYYSTLDKDSMALSDMRVAAKLSPDNNVYLERLGEASINMKLYDEAIDTYEKLYATNKERTDVLNILIQLYNQTQNYDAMIHTINRIEAVDGSNERTALAKMRVYSLQGKEKEELNELKKLSEKHPGDMNYRVMMGNWLLQNGREKDALDEYRYVLKQEPENIMAQMSLLDYYRAQGNDELGDSIQNKILISTATPLESKITMIRKIVADSERQGGDSTKVLELFRRIVSQPQKTSDMLELYAAYMSLKKMPQAEIDTVLTEALGIEPDNAGVRLQLIQSKIRTEDAEGIISLCKPALEYNPDEMMFYYFLGLAYNQQEALDDALQVLRLGLNQVNETSDKNIVSDLYGIMGDLLHKKSEEQAAFAAYDSCLQWKSDNYEVLNNYAYYLSEKGEHLQKAEQMSYRTVKADPANSTFLDTYAWILFMQERYEEARIYIDLALQNDSVPGGVILEHAGDIYAVNNEIDKAVEYWKEAVKDGNDSKVLIRKIKIRKYIKE